VFYVTETVSNGRPGRSIDLPGFRKRGYAIVRRLFDPADIELLREVVVETVAEREAQGRVYTDPGVEGTIRWLDSDLLSIPALRHVLLDRRLRAVIGEMLDGEPLYYGDSSLRIGKNGVRGWHRDNVNRRRWSGGPDWQGAYPLVRCGLYLQDQSSHSGGLSMRLGSHQLGRVRPSLPKLLDLRIGDLVAWNMRTVHSGEVVRMRGLPSFPLNPRLQTRLPETIRVPEGRERIAIFVSFGLPSVHLDNYIAFLKTRDYMRRSWSRSRFGPEVWAEAEGAGLQVQRGLPEYGLAPEPEN
jgi:Phytanoyl-CoA dioxygenase (PhyH)